MRSEGDQALKHADFDTRLPYDGASNSACASDMTLRLHVVSDLHVELGNLSRISSRTQISLCSPGTLPRTGRR